VKEPHVTGALEGVVAFLQQALMLTAPDLIDGLAQQLGDMEAIMHHCRLRQDLAGRRRIGRAQVHGHRCDRLAAGLGQALQ